MRKRSVNHIADTIFWYIMYLLPLILYVLYMFNLSKSGVSILTESGALNTAYSYNSFVSAIGLSVSTASSSIYTLFYKLFGRSDGAYMLFQGYQSIFHILAYFVSVYILHIMVDFLLFIPKLAMKWMNHFTNTED